jgi:hypothetical protein
MELRRILAAASFLLYAIAAIIAFYRMPTSWAPEYDLALPSAISNVVYGLQLGLTDSNVLTEFKNTLGTEDVTPASVEKAVAVIARGDISRGTALTTADGIGIGQVLFIDLAMRLFGPHLSSILYCFLCFMGISTLAFIGRYKGDRLIFVPAQFVALTCMLLTPLFTDPIVRDQASIGGNRFFGILGILPALQIFFEFADGAGPTGDGARKNWILLGTQTFILALVLLVRSGNAYMLAPAICAALFSVRRCRDNTAERQRLYRKFGNTAILGIVACVPNYVKSGRIGGILWHRAFVSFVFHPEWPFGNLRDVYACTKYIPEGLQRDVSSDRNGHCVWWAYPPNQTRTEAEVQNGTYGPEYETALRRAVFYVIFSYPRQALQLYFYYKPLLILDTLRAALDWQLERVPPLILIFAVFQLELFLWFVAASAVKVPFNAAKALGVLALFFLFSIAPPLVAWASLWTSADLIFYMYAAFAIGIAFFVQAATLAILANADGNVAECLKETRR